MVTVWSEFLIPSLNLSKFLDLYKFDYQSVNNSDIISGFDWCFLILGINSWTNAMAVNLAVNI